MWETTLNLEKMDKWLASLPSHFPTGNRDPYSSSMRNTCRFVSALTGNAISRPSQQKTDLSSAGLIDSKSDQPTRLAKSLLSLLKYFQIDEKDEQSSVLILFLEALDEKVAKYQEIAKFWYKISHVFPLDVLCNNISASYMLSYLSVPDKTGYCPLDDVLEKTQSCVTSFDINSLLELNFTQEATTNAQSLIETIKGYVTRSRREEMLQALFIIFSFDKRGAIDKIVDPIAEEEKNKKLKQIMSYYQKDYSFSSLLFGPVINPNEIKFQVDPVIKDLSLQTIYYGAPGTGKSYAINRRVDKANTIRTTFHPDSDYSTFVGAYKPTNKDVPVRNSVGGIVTEEKTAVTEPRIVYEFVDQAFLQAYIAAWTKIADQDTDRNGNAKKEFLVIEEINRGNCAQIFGDLFQLLDRNDDGFSDYPVSPDQDIEHHLQKAFSQNVNGDTSQKVLPQEVESYLDQKYEEPGLAKKIMNGQILLLPNNLYIWATMNTSDQSLFPIDSAFKRRWDWKYVPITEGRDKDTKAPMGWKISANGKIYDWWRFIQVINVIIGDLTKSQDKKLGYFFCKAKEGIISVETFTDKVLFYLWNEILKDFETDREWLKDEDGYLTFDKFYSTDDEGETFVKEDKVAVLLDNLEKYGITQNILSEIPTPVVNDTPSKPEEEPLTNTEENS